MATFAPTQLNINPPTGGFQTGGWYSGRQYWNGTLSEPGVIHPSSNQPGAGQLVSAEVNLQSDVTQGNQPGDIEIYLEEQRRLAQGITGQPTAQPTAQPTTGAGATGAGGITGAGISSLDTFGGQPALLNLPDLQKTLLSESGISEKEDLLVERERQYLEAKGKISDNPFLSASMIDQRLQRLQRKYEEETLPLKSDIAMKRADIETQMDLQLKQFDLESQQARDNLDLAQGLLDMGALDKATGEDIASLVRATGIPSSMWLSAIESRKVTDKNTQIVTSTADSGEVTVSTIDKDTGAIINQQSLGFVGNAQTGGSGGSLTESERKRAVLQELKAELDRLGGEDKFVSPEEWNFLKQQWLIQGYSAEEFDQAFARTYLGDPGSRGFSTLDFQLET